MINRLIHSRLGNISLIALVTISYFVPRSLRSLVTKCDIVPRAIKLVSPGPSYDNLYLSTSIMSFYYYVSLLLPECSRESVHEAIKRTVIVENKYLQRTRPQTEYSTGTYNFISSLARVDKISQQNDIL